MDDNIIYNIVCLNGTSLHSAPVRPMDSKLQKQGLIFLSKFFLVSQK
jgi:hypothetical protein